jgi:hypothetical protein
MINKTSTSASTRELWAFYIGGYQRPEVAQGPPRPRPVLRRHPHYQKILAALAETRRLMAASNNPDFPRHGKFFRGFSTPWKKTEPRSFAKVARDALQSGVATLGLVARDPVPRSSRAFFNYS